MLLYSKKEDKEPYRLCLYCSFQDCGNVTTFVLMDAFTDIVELRNVIKDWSCEKCVNEKLDTFFDGPRLS